MTKRADHIWMDGSLRRWEDATVHVMSHALHYGSSVFEGIRVYETPDGPAVFRLEDHIARLFKSARLYRIEWPYTQEELVEACRETVRANGIKCGYIRPLAFRGAGPIGVCARDTPIHVIIAAFPWGVYLGDGALENGVDVCVSSWNRLAPNTVPPGMKAGGNYLSSILIGYEAKDRGFHEGIGLGRDGLLSEGSGENLFLVEDGVIRTPPGAASILKGITRDTAIKLLADLGHAVIEQPLPREALYTCDEAFFTGTAVEITPIRSIDGFTVGNGERPVTRAVQKAFFGLFDGSTPDSQGWLNHIG
ncbi:branched-chain amino acid transaminase [Hyphobacterium sp. Y6023]|uniref:Branched-chain-amino-acid aminotransferase n=2 Tax=Hyphobacterium marinum TaxID=3116574 RepID=A0ABU7LZL0_9PROT|nr:branched-chain amino acid transaminase [Hyphobacterium sp. Y6023]MEE2566996.1 branched-chain amino acid transaminase [Hyphobacterium sp. Y6023]